MVEQSIALSAGEILDMALPVPKMGTIDFRMLHTLLKAIITEMNLETLNVNVAQTPLDNFDNNQGNTVSTESPRANSRANASALPPTSFESILNLTNRIQTLECQIQGLADATAHFNDKINTQDALTEKVNQLEVAHDIVAKQLGITGFPLKTDGNIDIIDSILREIVNTVNPEKPMSISDQISMITDFLESVKSNAEHMEENQSQIERTIENLSPTIIKIEKDIADHSEQNQALKTETESVVSKALKDCVKVANLKSVEANFEKQLSGLTDTLNVDKKEQESMFERLHKALLQAEVKVKSLNRMMRDANGKIGRNKAMLNDVLAFIKYGESITASAARIDYVKDLSCMSCNQEVEMRQNEVSAVNRPRAMKSSRKMQKRSIVLDDRTKVRTEDPKSAKHLPSMNVMNKFCSCLLVEGTDNAIYRGDPMNCKC